ncbi:MAG: bifunctional tRNA (5-methylaminomethyl-2-thiouridine)(34)-methyltransferase MnmD/FAD-dependent 5-carboxymethylaminomethyl-2-thiouridine(34) oxidoreductase MnmC [Betaproteobacteria bacterium]|nr:MAG: bifunctional tRNA (5-methylaminomethyl-2-thiouridine)(34)-methyltransferase MnmD/FAD-dependent 5-carboxymethylaminomethyl-2-thiouridine(34) oxidoreductase MnmC [Betaproteobacteria bacterium]
MPASVLPGTYELRDGTPYSAAYGDVYHSADGGPAQAQHVFLAGNELPARWARRERYVILETGFGFGLNFLVTWRAWKDDPNRCRRLHYVAVEKHPFALADLRALHERYPELKEEATALHAVWPLLVSGVHRLELGDVVLTLFFADIAVLRDLRASADAIYLDGFAPANNPEMWTPQMMRALSRLAAPGATLATWSVAAPVREALQATGFAVEKRPGFGGKREMLIGRKKNGDSHHFSPATRSAVVIGAGVAGAAVCERLCARGWEVELYERHAEPAQEASGNLAGAFHPVLTPDDSIFARLTRAAFLYALPYWERLPGVEYDRCGVLQLARNDKEIASQRAAVAGLPADYAQLVSREEASEHAGVPVAAPGLWFPQGGWIKPRTLVRAQLEACGTRLHRRFSTTAEQLPRAPVVVLANASEAPKLCAVPHLRLRRVRGQLTYVPEDALEPPHVVVLRGGMVLPPIDGVCVAGATYDLEDPQSALREEDHAGNLERLRDILGVELRAQVDGRVAFRAVTPDRLPVVGKLADGVYGAFAYGSRGLVWAALAAELIAAEVEGEPLPLASALASAMDPGRFKRRAVSRGSRP